MLERNSLLLAASGTEAAVNGRRWPVSDADSEQILGFVGAKSPAGLLRWLFPAILEVRETEDAALLMTVHRTQLSSRWRVADAEGRFVGRIQRVRGQVLLIDRFRRLFATLEGERIVRLRDGVEVASLGVSKSGVLLRFVNEAVEDPFYRMLLLAAAVNLLERLN